MLAASLVVASLVSAAPGGPSSSGPAPARLPFDPAAIARQVHFAFKAAPGGAEVLHATWEAHATARGLAFAPVAGRCLPALELAASELSRGGALALGAAAPDARGLLVREGEALREEVEAGEAGLELRWRFARAPRGDGPLVVRVPVSGLPAAGASSAGLDFGRPGGKVRLSHAWWVGQDGARTRVEGEWVGGAVEYRVSAALLAGSRYPAVLDPLVSAEVLMPGPGGLQAAPRQYHPSGGTDGTDFLVVWEDSRSDPFRGNITATRVTSNGQVLDATGIPITSNTRYNYGPRAAFGGGVWLVVYADGSSDLFGRRLKPDGSFADLAPLFVAVGPNQHRNPAVDFDGTNFVVAWEETSAQSDIWAGRVTPGGVPLDGRGFAVSNAVRDQRNPDVACAGALCLVTWDDDRNATQGDIYAARLTGTTVLDPAGFSVYGSAGAEDHPAVSSGAGEFLVAFESATGASLDVLAARVTFDGGVLDAPPLAVATGAGDQTWPRTAFDGLDFVVSCHDESTSRSLLTRVTAQGAVLSPPTVFNGSGKEPAVGATPGGLVLTAWVDWSQGVRLLGRRFDNMLQPYEDGGFPLTFSAPVQEDQSVASNGTDFLVVYDDLAPGSVDVRGARVSGDGGLLDPTGLDIATGPNDQNDPVVAWGGGAWLVAWEESTSSVDIKAKRVTAAGAVDPTAVRLSRANATDESQAAIAFDGTQFLVAWRDTRTPASAPDIWGTRVSTAGQPIDAADFPIGVSPVDQFSPAVAAMGSGAWLVSWSQEDQPNNYFLYVNRVSSAGAVLDGAAGRVLPQLRLGYSFEPAIACGPASCLVVFREYDDLFALRVDLQGQPLDVTPLVLSDLPDLQAQPTVVFDGDHWFAAWEDRSSSLRSELRGTRVELDGRVGTPGGALLVASTTDVLRPRLAWASAGRMLLSYTRFVPGPAVAADQVGARLVLDVPNGGACAAGSECQSGFCVDGVCCDTACGGGAVDCQACSVAAGAAADGTCATLAAGKTCRPVVSSCDVAETCDGSSLSCPADAFLQDGLVCNGTGQCTSGVCVGGGSGNGFLSSQATFLACGEVYRYSAAGTPVVSGPGPVTFELAAKQGETLPAGMTVDPATGQVSWTPPADAAGSYVVFLIARGNGWAASQQLEIDLDCAHTKTSIGCGCAATDLPGLALLLAPLLLRRRRLRAQG